MKTLLAICFLAFSGLAVAQTAIPVAPSRDDLMKMFDVLRVRQQTENVMQTMLAQMKSQIKGDIEKRYPNLSAEASAQLEQEIADAVKLYPVNEMLDDLIPVYQKHLTKGDVDAIVAFYSSPAGQHFLDKMPDMTQEAMQTMMTKLQVRTAEYSDKVERHADELAEPKKP
jgi:hypothetical protein